MRCTITGRNIEVTPGLRDAIQGRVGKLDRCSNPDTEMTVTLSVQKDKQNIEVTIPVKGNTIRAEEPSSDMHVSIDLVKEIVGRQIKRYKTRLIDEKQAAQSFSELFINEGPTAASREIKVVETKEFAVKLMDLEGACLQTEPLGHNFYISLDSDTDQANVVYKGESNTHGLTGPES